jgi:hypothetical protein
MDAMLLRPRKLGRTRSHRIADGDGRLRGHDVEEDLMRLAMCSLLLVVASNVNATENQHLSLGEVAVPTNAPNMQDALKRTLQSEMRELDLRGAHKNAIMSVSLVKMQMDRAEASCVISATLRSRDGGVLFAVLEGRARAQGGSDHIGESALRGCVHGALSRVAEALK